MTTQYHHALQAYAEGRYEEAMQQFSELLHEDPRNPKLLIWLGATFRKAGKIEYARAQYQQALELTDDPDLIDLAQTCLAQMQSVSATGNSTANSTGNFTASNVVTQAAPPIAINNSNTPIPPPGHIAPVTESNGAVTAAKVESEMSIEQAIAPLIPPPDQQQDRSDQSLVQPSAQVEQKPEPQAIATEPDAIIASKPVAFSTKTKNIDKLRPSSMRQRLTGWAIALSLVPTVIIGILAYQASSKALDTEVRKSQEEQSLSLSDSINRFMVKQYEGTQMLGTLLTYSGIQPKQGFTADQKLLLLYRLNLYRQAYKSYDSIALFSPSGELIVQSSGTTSTNKIGKDYLAKVLAAPAPVISEAVQLEQDYVLNFAVPVINPATKNVTMVLQSRMPLKSIQEDLKTSGVTDYLIIDAAGKYLFAAGIAATTGQDAAADYPFLADVQSLGKPASKYQSVQNPNGDRQEKLLAYAPTAQLAGLPDLKWSILTSVDTSTALAGNNVLLLIFGVGICVTPILVGLVAYSLSERLIYPIEVAAIAIRKLAKGKLDTRVVVKGNDELAELSSSINEMAEQFQSLIKHQQQEKEHLQRQMIKMFKALQKLAKVGNNDLKLSDESIGMMLKRIQANVSQKEAEAKLSRREKEDMQKHLLQILEEVKDISKGDLTVSATLVEGDMANVSEFFNAVVESLRQVVTQVKTAAGQVNYSLGQNERAVTQLANEAFKQADEINRTLNSMQILAVSAQSVADSTRNASEIAHSASSTIASGNKAVDKTMQSILNLRATVAATAKKVKRLGESSQKISKVVSLINEIAVQTNFLAINASIEASRAGEDSKGFVTMAEEVGALATRSATATREIEQLIGNIQTQTSEVVSAMEMGTSQVVEGSQLVEDAQRSLAQINQVSRQIDDLVKSISEATVSQAATSECVAGLMKDIAQVSGRTASSSRQISKSLQATVQVAEQLQHSVSKFKVESSK
jgi:methyl-accepting chemotaxis protein PixJ